MVFSVYFLLMSIAILVGALVVVRKADHRMRTFGLAATITLGAVLGSRALALAGAFHSLGDLEKLFQVVTLATLSAALVIFAAWTARVWSPSH